MNLLKDAYENSKKALKDLTDIVEMPESPRQKRERFREEVESQIGKDTVKKIFSELASENFSEAEEIATNNGLKEDYSKIISVFLDDEVDRGKSLMKKIGKQLKQAEYSLQEANNVPTNDPSFPHYVEEARQDFEAIEDGELQKAQGHFETALHIAEHYGWHQDRFEREHEEALEALERIDEAEKELENLESKLS